MQYFRPEGAYFVGDCMPFFHGGVYHLYYLLDEGHHSGLGGLGGHQWAHASTTDLVHWEHHPLALTITEDWEGSICTGSVFWHDTVYYAFFAVRTREWKERLAFATSSDGITFVKQEPYPLQSAPDGYEPGSFRDPFVIDSGDGVFQMLVTARVADYPLHDRGACLLRLTSTTLTEWDCQEPFLLPSVTGEAAYTPECADYFEWNGWFYLIFGNGVGPTRYRMSRAARGPWLRPATDILDSPMTSVMKTAAFGVHRRIGAAWLPERGEDGGWKFGGNAFFRELLQNDDGGLGVRTPPEMIPKTAPAVQPLLAAATPGASGDCRRIHIDAPEQEEAAALLDLPADYRLRCRVTATGAGVRFGLGIRSRERLEGACELSFIPGLQRASLGDLAIDAVQDLDQPFDLDMFVAGSIIDVGIDNRRCLMNRWPFANGDQLFFWCANGEVDFDSLEVAPLL